MVPENEELRFTVLPLFASGHIIPIINMARLFARHSATVTTTEFNACVFQRDIDRDRSSDWKINTHVVAFPYVEVGLPLGIENYSNAASRDVVASS